MRNLTSLRQGAPVDIDFVIEGPDIETLAEFSEKLRQRVAKLPGIVDTYTTLRIDKPELRVEIDRERAAALGVEVQEIAETLRIAVGGDDRVSRYHDHDADDTYDVELRLVGIDRGEPRRDQPALRPHQPASLGQQRGRRRLAIRGNRQSRAPASTSPPLTRLDNVVQFADAETLAPHRPRRPPADGRGAGQPGAWLRPGRSHRSRSAARPTKWACRRAMSRASPAAAANWSGRSRTSAGRSPCRSSSCTWCWPPSSSTWSIR